MEPLRIILADDHALLREGTRHVLEKSGDLAVVGEAGDGEQALELASELHPDVAIVDIRMPKLNGVEVVSRMRECSPNTKTIVLTAYDDGDCILASMQAGASGYLLKTTKTKELIDAVRLVGKGESVLDPAVAAKVARLWDRHRTMTNTERCQDLSMREREVLELSAKGLRNKAIADRLGISVRTVEVHFNSIFRKLHVSSRLEAVLYALSRNSAGAEKGDL